MRKGGQHKPLILDKYSAEDLNAGAAESNAPGTKRNLPICSVTGRRSVGIRPDRTRQPAARGRAARRIKAPVTEVYKGV